MKVSLSRKEKIIGGAIGLVAVGGIIAGCSSSGFPSGQASENAQQQRDTTALEQTQPIPHFNWSQIRQTKIDSETIEANGTQTTSFGFQMGDPNPIWSCPSIGEPVPSNAELSNPAQVIKEGQYGDGSVTIGQQDPNGIYSSPSTTGTDVVCINSAGQKYLQYWEGNVDTVSSGATWQNGQIVVSGTPTFQPITNPNK